MEDEILCESEEFVKTVFNEKWNYLIFDVAECTEKALDKKCEFIMKCQKVDWKPLKLEHKRTVNMYIKTFYVHR